MSELRKFVIENTEIHSDQQIRLVNQVDKLIATNAELVAALEGLMPFAIVKSPNWAPTAVQARNHEMYEQAFSNAETALERAKQ